MPWKSCTPAVLLHYRTMSSDCLLQSKLWVLDHVLNDEWACQQRMRVWAVEVETSKLEMSLNNCLIAFFSFDGCLPRCYYSNCILTTRWEKCAFNRPSITRFTLQLVLQSAGACLQHTESLEPGCEPIFRSVSMIWLNVIWHVRWLFCIILALYS